MIVVVVGSFSKSRLDSVIVDHRTVIHFCYDAESLDDAKKDLLVHDLVLKLFADGYGLSQLTACAADMMKVVEACKEAAKASLDALYEAATKEAGQEGKE